MNFKCPNCEQPLKLKIPQPGKYRSRCKQCSADFQLTVSDQQDIAPVLRKIAPKPATKKPAVKNPNSEKPVSKHNQPDNAAVRPAVRTPVSGDPDSETRPEFQPTIVPPTIPDGPDQNPEDDPPVDSSSIGDGQLATRPESTQAGSGEPSQNAPTDELRIKKTKKKKNAANVPASAKNNNRGASRPKASQSIPERLGGYRILDELGQGAMGAVYRANQISLDREVALKTILPRYAREPRMIARFTREAYAAAQISHHNVVQIHDLGCDAGTYFFAMEFVPGRPLSDVLKEHGKLDATIAVSYILQAARGLQAAHSHGMVHRDVKPANLLISDDGIIKVADLGLVKVLNADDIDITDITDVGSLAAAKADITLANVAMGTAAFMAPEQADNATAVDHRADVYSLGCTLYVLLTGMAPFQGTTALEVITKHRTEPVVRPDAVVSRIPKDLSDIVLRMVTKRPIDRPDNMGQVIEDLETFLGVSSTGTYSPTEEHAKTLERCVNEFNAASGAQLRNLTGLIFPLACFALGLLSFIFSPWMGTALLGCGISTVAAYFVISGFKEKTDLFGRVRELLALSSWTDRVTWLGGAILLLAIAWVTNMLLVGLVILLVSIGLGMAYYVVCDVGLAKQRSESVQTVEDMLRSMRLRGLEESELRGFVARYSGNDWEEFYESLFGYHAKLKARTEIERGDVGKGRRRFRRSRDFVHEFVSSRIKAHHERREAQHLQQVEHDDLQAQGISSADAMEQAKQIAASMVRGALDSRTLDAEKKVALIDPTIAAQQKRERIKRMLAEARNSKPTKRSRGEIVHAMVSPWFGSRMRFIWGCLLITGCLLWVRQNGLISGDLQAATNSALAGDVAQIQDAIQITQDGSTTALSLPIVGRLFDSFLPGIAGLCLLISAFVSGTRMSMFAIPATILILFGEQFGVPGIAAIGGAQTTSIVAGVCIVVAGFLLCRPK